MAVKDCDMDTLLSLHRRGLIYFDVPVSESDRISVPTLDGFVMNRITGDSCETLLYKIFVSVDERTTVSELASDLLVNIDLVRQAISVFLRLGFACKRNSQSIDSELNAISTDGLGNPLQMETEDLSKKKIAILFDSTLAAYLMMGNLSSGLKRHAVTMFEVGKLTDENLESFLTELDNLTDVGEGEAQIYYEHAVNLRAMLRFFRHLLSNSGSNNMFNGLDLLRCGSLLSLEPETRLRILKKNYGLLISLAPITYEDQQAANYQWPPHFGPPIPEANSPWFRLFIAYLAFERRSNFMDIPPCLILSRGSRLNTIPTCMLPYSLFSFIAWGHDPTIIESANLLSVVNDALVASPVFIQVSGSFRLESSYFFYLIVSIIVICFSDNV
ncbi:unnamed protein product [Protopolystoma xenopodis]|uniref:FAM91 N-terminal domain-containing protein n=1 Tax=Protopolystoma xenopodis TaxID=117903 RepID=A0A3S5BLU9_9PLAT|nr:unnamed protein product [Protopolystoma xenopodis]